MRPLILLDVDGVLNALSDFGEHEAVWPEWRRDRASVDGTSWPILWTPAVVNRLRAWHDGGRAEIQWLTTWRHDANGELRTLLGLPELVVAGTYQDEDDPGAGIDAGGRYAHPRPRTRPDLAQPHGRRTFFETLGWQRLPHGHPTEQRWAGINPRRRFLSESFCSPGRMTRGFFRTSDGGGPAPLSVARYISRSRGHGRGKECTTRSTAIHSQRKVATA